MIKPWIGVDLDGTLAFVDPAQDYNPLVIGPPIPPMVERVKYWLSEGVYDIRVFTARASHNIQDLNMIIGDRAPAASEVPHSEVIAAIEAWCLEHLGQKLPVTCTKDYGCAQIWDDRAVTVVYNVGIPLTQALMS